MIIYWVALSVSFIVTALGQVIYKLFARTHDKWLFFASIGFFVIAPFTSYVALQKFGIGMVYIGAAFSQILVLFLSKQILHERLSRDHFISMSLIVFGLVVYALGSTLKI